MARAQFFLGVFFPILTFCIVTSAKGGKTPFVQEIIGLLWGSGQSAKLGQKGQIIELCPFLDDDTIFTEAKDIDDLQINRLSIGYDDTGWAMKFMVEDARYHRARGREILFDDNLCPNNFEIGECAAQCSKKAFH